ncbi:DNL-type zinc finger protein [Seminavis robusta]|uniref:DNL-type zinc finger protein n=1 Tax=Seminavis robusta TaxID=568900 RepID=A0A9N8DA69_9STRA|nr:DNL-type zinc finger protein [Seminavis robusta]|eukprot:Sro13_g009840.1 DNL-type zinc finger protein (236) ;mRNA; r:46619-47326
MMIPRTFPARSIPSNRGVSSRMGIVSRKTHTISRLAKQPGKSSSILAFSTHAHRSFGCHHQHPHCCLPQRAIWTRYRALSSSSNAGGDDAKNKQAENTSDDDDKVSDEFQIPGAQAGGKKLAIVYTCNVCETRSIKQFSEHSYQNGVVLVRCPGCQNLHLIADRLGIFEGESYDIEKAMAKLGENVNVINDENVLEMSVEDLVGKDMLEKLASNQTEEGELATDKSGGEDEDKKK